MFEFLFKYPLNLLQRGEIQLAWSWEAYAATVLVVILAVAWILGYGTPRRGPGRGFSRLQRLVLAAVRVGLLATVALILLEPELVVSAPEPVRGRVAVLIDDSLSMRIPDQDGAPRAVFAARAFAPETGTVARRIETRFDAEYFRFSADTSSIRSGSELTSAGARTDLAGALGQAFTALRDSPLAAVVVVSDGGHQGATALEGVLLPFRTSGVPVHTVGVGLERYSKDLELSSVRVPREALSGETIEAGVTIVHRGLGDRRARLTVEDDGLIVAEEEVPLPPDRDRATVNPRLALEGSGPHRLAFRLDALPGEALLENNQQSVIVNIQGGRFDVLHLEGEPRFEVKFTRRAVAEDEHIRLVSLVRTAENKLYRVGIAKADELVEGFPRDAETLFRFRVLILGSVEATQLTAEQQRLITEFVARRGGGLLLLGGRYAFAEGGYGASLLSGLLPVVLEERAAAFRSAVQVEPTDFGMRHLVVRAVGADPWPRLPTLTVVNPIRRLKPGATLLLSGSDGGAAPLVVLAYHRYGRGTVAALPVRDTWRWQMHGKVPVDDQTHERLWRQLLRWLAHPATGRVQVHLPPDGAVSGHPLTVDVEVLDAAHRPLGGADVRLTVDTPVGDREEHRLTWQASVGGRYRTTFTPTETGRYDLRVSVTDRGQVIEPADAYLEVTSTGREYFGAELAVSLLRRIATQTGGRYYSAEESSGLVDALEAPGSGRDVSRRLPLWDAPSLFLLVVMFACLEWTCRRRWRLP